jgi:nitroreductase
MRLIQERRSSRIPFNPQRRVPKEDLMRILEAARWAPTAHNMQNYEIIIIDQKGLLREIGEIKSKASEDFIRENYQQLSRSKKELRRKKVGILGTSFPASWRDPARLDEAVREAKPEPLKETIRGSQTILIVVYDSRKRAPASKGDFLGILSLGCVMENMWLMAQYLGVSFHVMSVFSSKAAHKQLAKLLSIPTHMKIAFAVRLGYPMPTSVRYLRVRRDVEDFTHDNRFGNKRRIMQEHRLRSGL